MSIAHHAWHMGSLNQVLRVQLFATLGTVVCQASLSMGFSRQEYSSLLFSCSVMSNSLPPHGLQHTRLSCLSLSPRVCSNSCPLSRWYHPTISSSVTPFSSCPQSFPKSGSFPMSRFFAPGGKSIRVSASASVLPMNIQGWFPFRIDWFDVLAVQWTLKSLLQHHKL